MQFDSTNKTILLVSDVHQEVAKLRTILAKESWDIAICLGDWFDSYDYNSPSDTQATCDFLKEWLPKPNFFSLLGNHDVTYLYGNPNTFCSGYSPSKLKIFYESWGTGDAFRAMRQKFLWYVWVDDFLCSHGGVHSYHFPPRFQVNKKNITKWLDKQIQIATPRLETGDRFWLYGAGIGRGGYYSAGGLTWLCFDSEFEPVEGLKQIVGHTSHPSILNHVSDGNLDLTQCENLDIDCHLNQYLLVQNGKLVIKRFCDL